MEYNLDYLIELTHCSTGEKQKFIYPNEAEALKFFFETCQNSEAYSCVELIQRKVVTKVLRSTNYNTGF